MSKPLKSCVLAACTLEIPTLSAFRWEERVADGGFLVYSHVASRRVMDSFLCGMTVSAFAFPVAAHVMPTLPWVKCQKMQVQCVQFRIYILTLEITFYEDCWYSQMYL